MRAWSAACHHALRPGPDLDRPVREVAAVNASMESEAIKLIEAHLAKSPKRAKSADAEIEAEVDAEEEQEEAA